MESHTSPWFGSYDKRMRQMESPKCGSLWKTYPKNSGSADRLHEPWSVWSQNPPQAEVKQMAVRILGVSNIWGITFTAGLHKHQSYLSKIPIEVNYVVNVNMSWRKLSSFTSFMVVDCPCLLMPSQRITNTVPQKMLVFTHLIKVVPQILSTLQYW